MGQLIPGLELTDIFHCSQTWTSLRPEWDQGVLGQNSRHCALPQLPKHRLHGAWGPEASELMHWSTEVCVLMRGGAALNLSWLICRWANSIQLFPSRSEDSMGQGAQELNLREIQKVWTDVLSPRS